MLNLAGSPRAAVRVALFPAGLVAYGELQPVDLAGLDARGGFALRARQGVAYRVVAWLPGAAAPLRLALVPSARGEADRFGAFVAVFRALPGPRALSRRMRSPSCEPDRDAIPGELV